MRTDFYEEKMLRKSLLKQCFIVSLNAKWGHRVYKIKNYKKKINITMQDCTVRYYCPAEVSSASRVAVSEEGGAGSQHQLVSFPREMT